MTPQPPPRATLILVRHGETEGESSIRYHGRNDVPLSELGRAQMRAARAAIESDHGGLAFERVFTSPLVRAAEGARIIADAPTPIALAEFAEVHFGDFEGLTREEISARFPDEFARWRSEPLSPDYTYPGGENRAAFTARVERGAVLMLSRWTPERASAATRALVVAHRGVIRTIVKTLTGAEPTVELGSIQILKFTDAWNAAALDLVAHLTDARG
ncbi:MAG: histidine phosphatase family protein [Candidatus Binataceae bacterium]